ncbi:hypothetical protein ACPXCG_21505 [Gordonia sp. DT218]|uniref:hypothetical protein n=1 Tax=Gordonia sp. DT218 TaxID=3416659 RepID=UPI003CFAA2FC
MTASGIATINTRGSHTAIWYTDCTVDLTLARLCGAWVDLNEDDVTHVLSQRIVLPFPNTPVPDLAVPCLTLDAHATHEAITREIERLDHLHHSSRTAAGAARAAISWPTLPAELDFEHLPARLPGVNDDPLIADTIAVARWLEALADAWTAIETRRTSRDHLCEDHPHPRPFPAITSAD